MARGLTAYPLRFHGEGTVSRNLIRIYIYITYIGFKPAEMGVYTMSSVQKPFWLTIIWSYTIQYVRDCRNPVTRKSVLDHLETVAARDNRWF